MPADQPPSHLPGHEPYDPGLAARVSLLEQLAFDTKAVLDRMEQRFEQIDKRFDQMDRRFDQVETRIDRLETRIDSLKEQVGTLTKDVIKLGDDRVSLFKDVSEIRGRVSQHPTTIQLLGFVLAVLAISGIMRHYVP